MNSAITSFKPRGSHNSCRQKSRCKLKLNNCTSLKVNNFHCLSSWYWSVLTHVTAWAVGINQTMFPPQFFLPLLLTLHNTKFPCSVSKASYSVPSTTGIGTCISHGTNNYNGTRLRHLPLYTNKSTAILPCSHNQNVVARRHGCWRTVNLGTFLYCFMSSKNKHLHTNTNIKQSNSLLKLIGSERWVCTRPNLRTILSNRSNNRYLRRWNSPKWWPTSMKPWWTVCRGVYSKHGAHTSPKI